MNSCNLRISEREWLVSSAKNICRNQEQAELFSDLIQQTNEILANGKAIKFESLKSHFQDCKEVLPESLLPLFRTFIGDLLYNTHRAKIIQEIEPKRIMEFLEISVWKPIAGIHPGQYGYNRLFAVKKRLEMSEWDFSAVTRKKMETEGWFNQNILLVIGQIKTGKKPPTLEEVQRLMPDIQNNEYATEKAIHFLTTGKFKREK